tara:strand:- start:54 stop:359 length:306 start_codon:yes stop_codon:yes gene_type:complete
MADFQNNKPKDPNWIATFSLVRNTEKTEKKHPDFVHPKSDKVSKTTGKPFAKNFTINGGWSEATGYIQDDKSIKITLKKTSSTGSTPAAPSNPADDFMGQY